MRLRALILLFLMLKSSFGLSLCGTANSKAELPMIQQTECAINSPVSTCCSSKSDATDDHHQSHDDSNNSCDDCSHCACAHISAMDIVHADKAIRTENEGVFHQEFIAYHNDYFHLYLSSVFQPPKSI